MVIFKDDIAESIKKLPLVTLDSCKSIEEILSKIDNVKSYKLIVVDSLNRIK